MKKLITAKASDDHSNMNSLIKKRFSIKLNKKLIVILSVITLVGIIFGIISIMLANQGLKQEKYTVLKAGNNINKINVKGEVKSENATNVYSNVALPIKEVKVEVYDKVKVNDVLAVLDTTKLEDQIKELEATISINDASNKVALVNAKAMYDMLLTQSSDESNGEVKNAEVALSAAKLDFENKKKLNENNKELSDRDAISKQELKESEISYENAKNTFGKCAVDLDNIKNKVKLELITAKNNYDSERVKYEDASLHISLENLKKDLSNAVIKSPVDGTISVKNASVGNISSGILFEIKDENNVTINVTIKEVDIEKIKEGQKAEVRSDSTGTNIIEGQVVSVKSLAKALDESALTLNDDSNDKEAEFEAKIKITNPDYKLKIGMKAQADIILEQKNGVYIVPAESIIKDKDDKNCLYIADKQGKDYIIKQIPITKGTETDINVEVLGQDLKDDVIVLNNPSDYEVGSTIKIKGR